MSNEAETAVCREAVHRLACFLYAEAQRESVRTREALAAAISNQVRRLLPTQLVAAARGVPADMIRARLLISCLNELPARRTVSPPADDPLLASCLRIARRAFSGALLDPTRGATGFRKLGEPPRDARGTNPDIWIGSYVFFTESDAGTSAPSDATSCEKRV